MKYLIELYLCTDSDCYTSVNGQDVLLIEDPIYVKIKGSKTEVVSELDKVIKEAKTLKYEVAYGKIFVPSTMEALTNSFINQVKELIHSINNDKVREGRTFHEEGGNQYFTIEVIAL